MSEAPNGLGRVLFAVIATSALVIVAAFCARASWPLPMWPVEDGTRRITVRYSSVAADPLALRLDFGRGYHVEEFLADDALHSLPVVRDLMTWNGEESIELSVTPVRHAHAPADVDERWTVETNTEIFLSLAEDGTVARDWQPVEPATGAGQLRLLSGFPRTALVLWNQRAGHDWRPGDGRPASGKLDAPADGIALNPWRAPPGVELRVQVWLPEPAATTTTTITLDNASPWRIDLDAKGQAHVARIGRWDRFVRWLCFR